MPDVGVVLGTYQRLPLLQRCVASLRRSVGDLSYELVIVDGGSTDGTQAWLREQPDVVLIEQGQLFGAVAAFNAGFARVVDDGCPWVVQFNDDICCVGPEAEIKCAVRMMQYDDRVGAVALCSDRYGAFTFDRARYHGKAYCNQGVFRRAAGMAAARALGDPTGRAWWGRRHHTYAADTELGLWLWRLGWVVAEAGDLRVHEDYADGDGPNDALRRRNVEQYHASGTYALFAAQWGDPASVQYSRADAERFGGRLR